MNETKHPVKRRIFISISFLVVTLVFLIIWLLIRGKENASELIVVANIILPFLIGIGCLFTLIQFLVLDKLYYFKLTDDSIMVNTVFPWKSFKYTDIKSIAYNNGWFKGVNTGSYMKWPTVMKLEDPEIFIKELKQRYKKQTKKNLEIKSEFLK